MKVQWFIFLIDFVIVDVDKDVEIPLILGHPFLATFKALIDVNDGQIVLLVGDEKVVFELHQVMRHSSSEDDTCFSIDANNVLISECV